MKDILTVMKFTMREMAKRKSFIISTIIILVMIVAGFNIPNIIKAIKGEDTKDKLLIVDKDNIFEGNLESLKESDLGYEIEISNDTEEDVRKKIADEEIDSSIFIEKQDENIKIRYIVKSAVLMEDVPEDIINGINALYTNMQITKLGLTQEQLKTITPDFEFTLEQTDEEANGNVFVMMMISLVLFYAIYFCAFQVSSSITTEKTSKIIETLVTSTSPTNIIIGKTLGVGIIGTCQLVAIIATIFISAKTFLDPKLLEMALDTSSLTLSLGLLTILYFILGYLTFGLLYALTGSTVSKPEDVQTANQPITILTMVGFYLAYFSMMNPSSEINKLAALLPISSPFCMPFRIMMGAASTGEILLSLGILVITIIVVANIAIKIYKNAILNYGKSTIKDIIKMYKQK